MSPNKKAELPLRQLGCLHIDIRYLNLISCRPVALRPYVAVGLPLSIGLTRAFERTTTHKRRATSSAARLSTNVLGGPKALRPHVTVHATLRGASPPTYCGGEVCLYRRPYTFRVKKYTWFETALSTNFRCQLLRYLT